MLERVGFEKIPRGWTADRMERVKWLWEKDGLTAAQIAVDIGGFAHCADGGRSAILGMIDRRGWVKAGGPRVARKPVKELTRAEKAERQALGQSDADRALTQTILKARKRLLGGSLTPLVIKERPKPSGFLGITLMELGDDSCRFPNGEGAGITFCGQTAVKDRPYCGACMRLAYQPLPRRDNSPAPARFASSGALRVFGT